ncbi:hypothetical protein EG68_02982 [Paragonimus skrjabini miyazakii]|uniref:Alpha/beta hydrolase fold-3 domain-containing protein n=1 Tax=Paragonimus skrjabini miyazakii TaxID=59628 RepID=A0A8S9YWG7_9TREM|nr:hypothetical protein EG68_02982 [Paragonimus skrjabini miyazakii]
MEAFAPDQLPEVDAEIDCLYDTVRWLKEVKFKPSGATGEERQRLARVLRTQSDICRASPMIVEHCDFGVFYGQKADHKEGSEAFDWFPPAVWNSDLQHVVVYIHGGFWRALDLSESSHWATPITQAGGVFVALAYRLAPWQTLHNMPISLCKALSHIYSHTQKRIQQILHITPNIKIHLVGHSAGAQLAMETFYAAHFKVGPYKDWLSAVNSLILISGLYDLRPLIHTTANTALRLTSKEQAWTCSPLRYITDNSSRILEYTRSVRWLIAWAQYDPPGFIEQSKCMITELHKTLGNPAETTFLSEIETFCIADEDHFTSIEGLHYGPATSTLLKRIVQFLRLDQ